MPYIRKTYDEFDIEGDYGQGFEVVTCELTWKDARAQKKTYIENEPGIPFRIRKHRVKIDPEKMTGHAAIAVLITFGDARLSRMLDVVKKQITLAFEQKNDEALAKLQRWEREIAEARLRLTH